MGTDMSFRTWDELSEAEQLMCIYSDTHKDAYGFRPRPTAEQANDVQWLKEQIDWLEKSNDPQRINN